MPVTGRKPRGTTHGAGEAQAERIRNGGGMTTTMVTTGLPAAMMAADEIEAVHRTGTDEGGGIPVTAQGTSGARKSPRKSQRKRWL